MSDVILSAFAISLELGVPAIALWACTRSVLRSKAITVLGATTPYLTLYLAATVSYVLDSDDLDNRFSFFAMWGMSAIPYTFGVGTALALSLIPRPQFLVLRFGVGLLSAPLGFGLLTATALLMDPNTWS